jgi:uncharacterized protein YabE (DUF348 family)
VNPRDGSASPTEQSPSSERSTSRPGLGQWVAIDLGLGLVLAVLGSIYSSTLHTATVEINGVPFEHRTHQRSPEGILHEMRIPLRPEDLVEEIDELGLRAGQPLQLSIARTVVLVHDAGVSQARTHATDVKEALADLILTVSPHDQVFLFNQLCDMATPLPGPDLPDQPNVQAWLTELRRPVRLVLKRAVPISVQDDSIPISFYTTAQTVGEALFEKNMTIYAGDRIFPSLGALVTPGLAIYIERSKPVLLDVGGDARLLRTRRETVQELLEAEQVAMGPRDYLVPDPRTAITRDMKVSIVRVIEEHFIEETPIPFQARWEADSTMEIDDRYTAHWGTEGAERRRFRVHYENNIQTYQVEEEEWIARRPLDRVIKYGTMIVPRSIDTPEGSFAYWRKIRMLATAYSPSTAGVSVTARYYGITRMGLRATKGIVAIDPSVINLGQKVYVPDYGVAVAGDTGGRIKGRRIDLCYDDDNLVGWYRWVDVYVLAPAPPAGQIDWLLPDVPKEKR